MVDLTRTDQYEDGIVPDIDVETCLKVLRTVRNVALRPGLFCAETSLIMSHAHARIHDLIKAEQGAEDAAEKQPEHEPEADPGRADEGAGNL